MRMMGIAESAHGCQCHRGSVDILGREVHGRRPDISPPGQQRLPPFVLGSPSPFTTIVSNTEVPIHHTGTHLQSTLSSDPLTSRHRYTARSQFPSGFQAASSIVQPNNSMHRVGGSLRCYFPWRFLRLLNVDLLGCRRAVIWKRQLKKRGHAKVGGLLGNCSLSSIFSLD